MKTSPKTWYLVELLEDRYMGKGVLVEPKQQENKTLKERWSAAQAVFDGYADVLVMFPHDCPLTEHDYRTITNVNPEAFGASFAHPAYPHVFVYEDLIERGIHLHKNSVPADYMEDHGLIDEDFASVYYKGNRWYIPARQVTLEPDVWYRFKLAWHVFWGHADILYYGFSPEEADE